MAGSQSIGQLPFNVDVIEATSGMFFSPGYDNAQPTPDFHRECWTRYSSSHPACATAAPRNHAKSSALTHDFLLCALLWRFQEYAILVGATEEMAIEHLGDIAKELKENEPLIEHFHLKGFVVEQRTDIVVEFADGHQFRLIARGAEQKIRGRKWRGKRPGLIVFDDIEDDEQVASRDRRIKFRRWFFRACKQALRDGGLIRGHGTILHEDSLLARLMRNPQWDTCCYKAHESYHDFSNILWPEKFPEDRLRQIQAEFEAEGDSAGYSQEYLNDPFDSEDTFLRKEQFLPMTDEDRAKYKLRAVGVDFAVSKADKANRTSFSVGGKDLDRVLHFEDQRVGRMDSMEIVEEFFSIQEAWNPEVFFVEDGVIWKSICPMLEAEMSRRDIHNISWYPILPIKDKKARGLPLQKAMKGRKCRFDQTASWYPEYESELLRFTGNGEAILDDQFDSSAILARGLETWEVEEGDDRTEEEEAFDNQSFALLNQGGRSICTGY